VELLDQDSRTRVIKQSQTYETAPVGLENQPDFLNRVIEVEGERTPCALLTLLQDVERRLGREREVPNGPRSVDLDLLLFHDWIQRTYTLSLPHPRMHERRFVLIPLVEIAPDLRCPRLQRTYREVLADIDSSGQEVELYRG
jgi:2-amino-4-hydroxy-6-hydroxymethyldihydropteridine diphosphokinase